MPPPTGDPTSIREQMLSKPNESSAFLALQPSDHRLRDYAISNQRLYINTGTEVMETPRTYPVHAWLYNIGKVVIEHINHPILDFKNMPSSNQKFYINTIIRAVQTLRIRSTSSTTSRSSISRICHLRPEILHNYKYRRCRKPTYCDGVRAAFLGAGRSVCI